MEEIKIKTKDRIELAATLFQSRSGNIVDPVVIINSATGVNRKYYNRYATYLSENEYHVITYDYRGIAGSAPKNLRGFNASITDWGQLDVPSVIQFAKQQFPESKLHIIGHSIGGSLLGLNKVSSKATSIINIASQMAYYKDWKKPDKYKIYFLWHVILPMVTSVYGYFPGKAWRLENIPKGVVEQWHARRLTPSMEEQVRKAGYPVYFKEIQVPILNLGFTDDPIGTQTAIERMGAVFTNARVETKMISPQEAGAQKIGHFGFFRKEFRVSLWEDSLQWLNQFKSK